VNADELTHLQFKTALASAVPIVISGLHRQIQRKWTPEGLTATMENAVVTCIDCNSDDEASTTMHAKAFFALLTSSAQEGEVYKIKDWPPDQHFREVFHQHYLAYLQVLPKACADFVRPDGVSNIASCWPDTAGAPDLGPKMYTAMANRPDEAGTTRLHMDVTDAANLMVWAADGSRAAARWHIFRRGDAEQLKRAIRRARWCTPNEDPIHSQSVYLKQAMLEALRERSGVRPWVIEQRVGDLVIIPAGCPHQVWNYQGAIKIASDFIS
ncbi:hypothetical protein C8Q76DRAFT_567593, partial [Earliella scabrosa]